jgi:thioredoxin-like negative regulator of GroEL
MITRRSLFGLFAATAVLAMAPPARAVDRVAFDQAAFLAALDSGGPVLVDIYAAWCTTCRAQSKALGKLFRQRQYTGYRVFVVDYDTEKDIMRAFGATQRSTLIVFKGGVERGRVVGDTSAASIEALLKTGL